MMKLIWDRKRNKRLRNWDKACDLATVNHKMMISFWKTDEDRPIRNGIIIYKDKFPDFEEWCANSGHSFEIIF